MIKKGSVFAGKKGPLSAAGFATPVNISSTSSSFFDNSLPHMPPTGLGAAPGRNWQATPMNSHRFPPHHYQQQSQSSSSIRVHPTATLLPTPSSTMINRVKPHSLQGLVENLNELLAELAIPFVLRYDTKYGFEDILSILDHLTNPSRYVNHRFQPFPPLPQPTKPGGKLSLTDRWSYLKQVLLLYRLSTFDQLSRIKPERNMATDQMIVILECFIQLATCLLKSEQEQERIAAHHYLSEFKALMRQMFWIGRHDPSVMEEAMHELRRHCNGKDQFELLDRLEHEKQMSERTKERDQLKVQADEMKVNREEAENQCSTLTAANESMLIELTKKQEEFAEEQSKFNELTQIVEQKDFDKKHFTDRNQFLSDKLFAQQTDVELQRHLRSNTELKQQHEVLLSTLLLEQQLHSSAANEHKQLVKDLQDTLSKYQILLSAYKHKAPRVPSSALDFDLSDIIGDATSNISNDAVRQAQNALETLIKEITAEEILLTQRHRDLEQESKQKIDELQAAEREWKSAAKHGQRRAAQQNELSRFQQEIRSLTMKIAEFERKIEEKKAATIDLKKESDRIKTGIAELLRRFEVLETNYLSKEEELRDRLNWFLNDQSQLAKIFRRDVEEIKRMQQEHLTKLEMHSNPLAFDDLVQSEIQKLYHYRHVDEDEDDDDDEGEENRQRWIGDLEKVHDEHLLCLKKKKKEAKVHGPVIERLQELYENLHVLDE